MAGHSQFKNIMHRKGRQDAIKSKLFGKACARNHRGGQDGHARSGHERAVARGDHRGARREYDQGQYRARHSRRRPAARARITSRSATRATDRPGRGDRRSLDDNRNRTAAKCAPLSPRAAAILPRPARCPSCSIIWASSNMTRASPAPEAMFEAALDPAPTTCSRNETTHEIYAAQDHFGSVTKALELKVRRAAQIRAVWRRENTVAVNDEQGEKVLKMDSKASTTMTTCKRLCQFRRLGRAGQQDERVS